MSRLSLRALLGLLLALALAAFAAPAAAEDEDDQDSSLGEPVSIAIADGLYRPTPPAAIVTAVRDAAVAEFWQAVESAIEAQERRAAAAARRRVAAQQAAMAAAPAGSIDEIIKRHFGPIAGEARAIAVCESNLNPSAISPTNDHGLFQINNVHRGQFQSVTGHPWSAVYNPEVNATYAKWLYDQQGWRPWTCRKVL